MNVRIMIKKAVSYVLALGFAFVFGLFLDANVGWFIVLTLILAPLMSAFLAWIAAKLVYVSCSMDETLLSKGDTCSVEISLRNKSIFPTPPVEVIFTNDAGVRSTFSSTLVTVMPMTTKCFEVEFKAKICGRHRVGVDKVLVTDYFGIFSFNIKGTHAYEVSVIPDIAQINARDDSVLTVMQSSLHMDDSEDTVEASAYSFGGFPGYDNREYSLGDPLKRINWKQSAKRGKLLVRLDDEMAAQSVNVILDSTFDTSEVNIYEVAPLAAFRDYEKDEIIPAIAQEAIENALGIMNVLIRQSYNVNFYVLKNKQFVKYEIEDEQDLDDVRLELAGYSFADKVQDVPRMPNEEAGLLERAGIFSTPNEYGTAYQIMRNAQAVNMVIYSAVKEAAKQSKSTDNSIHADDIYNNNDKLKCVTETKREFVTKVVSVLSPLVIPFFLSVLLSIVVFSTYGIELVSVWTLVQVLMCAGVMAFGEYIRRHKVMGTLLLVVAIMVVFGVTGSTVVGAEAHGYMQWFMSAGDMVETVPVYLLTLLLVFTPFFGFVSYYFTVVQYRTSFLLLTSMIPLVLYVKVMKPIDMTQVVLITVLNIAAFLINNRTIRDKGKRIEGYVNGLVSFGLYAVLFVMIGLSVPDTGTPYYYMFEEEFLGGNATQAIPVEYSGVSRYSGNADGFNEMNNRKLYKIEGIDSDEPFYLKRQVFDIYDYENDRWHSLSEFSYPLYSLYEWNKARYGADLGELLSVLSAVEKARPGTLARYGIGEIKENYVVNMRQLYVEAVNYSSMVYITPANTVDISRSGEYEHNEYVMDYVTKNEEFIYPTQAMRPYEQYIVSYYDERMASQVWGEAGGTKCSADEVLKLLKEAVEILAADFSFEEYYEKQKILRLYIDELEQAMAYKEACDYNTQMVPSSIKSLAEDITKDCKTDYDKAVALQVYFAEGDFVYDLSYDTPDDSVEYFLFESRTGTCSDFATAYVLMARSVGLIVRYTEGFVPDMEANGEYIIRSNCGHAYPEVYIPNVGFVEFEATLAAVTEEEPETNSAAGYFVYAGARAIIIFGLVSLLVIVILFIYKVVAPRVTEARFRSRVRSVKPQQAVVMIYMRLQRKCAKDIIREPKHLTPYEYAVEFERLTTIDISELAYMVENVSYAKGNLDALHVSKAMKLYNNVPRIIKQYKTAKKKKNVEVK